MTNNPCPECGDCLDLPDFEFGYESCVGCAVGWGWTVDESLSTVAARGASHFATLHYDELPDQRYQAAPLEATAASEYPVEELVAA